MNKGTLTKQQYTDIKKIRSKTKEFVSVSLQNLSIHPADFRDTPVNLTPVTDGKIESEVEILDWPVDDSFTTTAVHALPSSLPATPVFHMMNFQFNKVPIQDIKVTPIEEDTTKGFSEEEYQFCGYSLTPDVCTLVYKTFTLHLHVDPLSTTYASGEYGSSSWVYRVRDAINNLMRKHGVQGCSDTLQLLGVLFDLSLGIRSYSIIRKISEFFFTDPSPELKVKILTTSLVQALEDIKNQAMKDRDIRPPSPREHDWKERQSTVKVQPQPVQKKPLTPFRSPDLSSSSHQVNPLFGRGFE